MSPEAKRQYQKDVKLYYTTVTGEKVVPKELGELNFSKIKLKDYTATDKCIGPDAPFQKEYYGTIKERLFQQYIQHIKDMIAKTNKSKGKLLDIFLIKFLQKKRLRVMSYLMMVKKRIRLLKKLWLFLLH